MTAPDLRAQARDAALREAEHAIRRALGARMTAEIGTPDAMYHLGMCASADIIRRLREPTPNHQQAIARGWE